MLKKKAVVVVVGKQEVEIPHDLRKLCVPIDSVKLWKDNPRKNDGAAKKLAELIEQNGFRVPIVVDQAGIIRAGNTRFKAAKLLGMVSIPVIRQTFTNEVAATAFALSDNKASEFSEWDDNILAKLMNTDGFNVIDKSKMTGFTEKELIMIDETETGERTRSFSLFPQDEIIDDLFVEFRTKGFPYRCLSIAEQKQELNALHALPLSACLNSTCGYAVADTYHPQRFHAAAVGTKSAYDSFLIDKSFRKALRMQLNSSDVKYGHFGFMNLVNGTQTCSNFRPAFAKYLYNTYCKEGGRVFDPSLGYGGRLVGFLASHCSEYFGTDPCVETFNNNTTLCKALNRDKKVKLINLPFEDFSAKTLENTVDLVFTSPPYFTKEVYSAEKTQSRERYKEYPSWRDKFLTQLLGKSYIMLKRGCFFVLNIEDVKIGKDVFPLVKDSISIGKKIGFMLHKEIKFKLPNRTYSKKNTEGRLSIVSAEASETVLIFKK